MAFFIVVMNIHFSCADDFMNELEAAFDEYKQLTMALAQDAAASQEPVVLAPSEDVLLGDNEDNDFVDTRESRVETPTFEEIEDDIYIDSLELKNMDIIDVLNYVSQKSGLNIVAGSGVAGKVSIYLKDVKLKDALHIILDSNSLAYKMENGILRVMPAAEFEGKYGFKFGGNIQTRIVHLKFSSASRVEAFLNSIKSPGGEIIVDANTNTLVLMDSPEKLALMDQVLLEIDVPIETKVFELSYAEAGDIAEKIDGVLTELVGKMKFDKRSNKIVITDTPMKIEEITRVIEAFDIKEKQVLIEAKIVQIVLTDQDKFGIDWEAVVAGYQGLTFKSNFDVLNLFDKGGSIGIGTLESDDYTVFIEALQSQAATNILSSPSITSLNNQEAKILVGATEPYVTSTTITPASGPTTTSESVNFIDVGVKLYVTPTIHKDDFVTMKIRPEVSSVTKSITTSNNNTIPVVETSEAETMVTVKDGITIVIGGLIKEEKIDTFRRVPVLGKIPLLGYAFKNSDELTRKTEIVIFLTPTIISGDVEQSADEYVYR